LQKEFPADNVLESQVVARELVALADLTKMILARGHGGIILIVGSETGEWLKSLSGPFVYEFATPDMTIRDAILKDLDDSKELAEIWQRMEEILEDFRHRFLMLAPEGEVGGMSSGVRSTASMAGVDAYRPFPLPRLVCAKVLRVQL
jgi:hypothetical protein